MKLKLVLISIFTIITITNCTPSYPPVNNKSKVIKLGNTEFTMKEVPGAKANTMILASWDDGNKEDIEPFWMAETELTSEVWTEVYIWATGDTNLNNIIDNDETQGLYTFANSGKVENFQANEFDVKSTFDPSKIINKQIPISFISWNDAIIFCNAITEYYNYLNPENKLTTVYNSNMTPIRDSREQNNDIYISVINKSNSTGFRLPTKQEWLCAASYKNGITWNHARSVSGDYSGRVDKIDDNLGPEFDFARILTGNFFVKYSKKYGEYAWYGGNSDIGNGPQAHDVATKKPNALGIYDMCGNNVEFIDIVPFKDSFDSIKIITMGGAFDSPPKGLSIDQKGNISPTSIYNGCGVRLAISFYD